MATFSERLKEALAIRNMSAAELSRRLDINESVISQYKKGMYVPKQRRLYEISRVLNVSIAWLMGDDAPMERISNLVPLSKAKKIPLLGKIACGEPILAEENVDGFVTVPEGVEADFALTCKGDSMIDARIFDGDIVYIKKQSIVLDGEIAAVLIGDEATLKRFYKQGDTVILKPENSTMSPLVYTKEQLNDIRIIGKAVFFLSKVI